MIPTNYRPGSTSALTEDRRRRSRGFNLLTLGAALPLLALGACSGNGDPSGTSPSSAATSADAIDEASEWAPKQERAAVDAARDVLATWSQPDLTHAQWWSDLSPLLSENARLIYEDTDPWVIPELEVPAQGERVDWPDPHVATVYFDTNEGRFGVDLSRTSLDGEWRGEKIIFPGDGSILQ